MMPTTAALIAGLRAQTADDDLVHLREQTELDLPEVPDHVPCDRTDVHEGHATGIAAWCYGGVR